ncbi:DUF2567 domain-containing protein [Mycobacterium lacus]|uniref:Uncharacterized protein n=1 Tax=Mycobacterium lacus TaxID=169765 RepID=A0A1X1Y1R3_9MYCO|nr:DUF2567 domain-containing protein [Mycobacterium lacus]ORW05035.1 hypothetical protein AWC15_02615 [Mycobacterium lacus]BBX96161.1 hypothetical protein MLAC_14550 [Mycobacterium lacus]
MTEEAEPAEPRPPGAPHTSRSRAIVVVTLGLAATGVLVGALWAWIAPAIHAVVALTRSGERVHDYLGTESSNFFVAPFLMLGLLNVVAVVASVLVWQWRAHRGPGMVVGLSTGLVAAAAAAAAVGAVLVRLRYGALDFDVVALSGADHKLAYVTQAPPVFFDRRPSLVAATLLSPAAAAALVYALLAAGNARDDLGGYPPVDASSKPLAVTPEAAEAAVSTAGRHSGRR